MNPEKIAWGKTLKKINPDAVVEYDGVEYSCLLEGDNATLYPCNVEKAEVTIPAKVSLKGKEYKVVALGAFAFYKSSITKVSFAEGIKSLKINNLAFFECKNLEEINFAESIEKLDLKSCIFGMCSALKSINLPQKVEELNIASCCFGNDQIEIKMPTKLKKLHLETSAFAGSENLHTFELNDSLEELYVGECAFGYTSLRSFKVPSSVTDLKIKKDAFRECKQLAELVIPNEKDGIEVSADVRALSDQLKAAKV